MNPAENDYVHNQDGRLYDRDNDKPAKHTLVGAKRGRVNNYDVQADTRYITVLKSHTNKTDRQTDRDRERQRETERETNTDRKRQTGRERERERQTDREKERDWQTERGTDRTERDKDRER